MCLGCLCAALSLASTVTARLAAWTTRFEPAEPQTSALLPLRLLLLLSLLQQAGGVLIAPERW